jgi:hypothetical protein
MSRARTRRPVTEEGLTDEVKTLQVQLSKLRYEESELKRILGIGSLIGEVKKLEVRKAELFAKIPLEVEGERQKLLRPVMQKISKLTQVRESLNGNIVNRQETLYELKKQHEQIEQDHISTLQGYQEETAKFVKEKEDLIREVLNLRKECHKVTEELKDTEYKAKAVIKAAKTTSEETSQALSTLRAEQGRLDKSRLEHTKMIREQKERQVALGEQKTKLEQELIDYNDNKKVFEAYCTGETATLHERKVAYTAKEQQLIEWEKALKRDRKDFKATEREFIRAKKQFELKMRQMEP